MFDYSYAHWLAFFSAAALLNLAPGPDMAYILGQSARRGVRSGFAAMLGAWSGTFVHVVLAALGLSALLAASALAFGIVKWAGAAYLVWLGIQAWRSGGDTLAVTLDSAPISNATILRRGILVAVLNPKVAVFFVAFLPQFVVVGAGPVPAQLFLHGSLIIAVAAFVEPPMVLLGGRLARTVRNHPRGGQWMDRALGSLFIALGLRLAASGRAV